VQTHTIQGIGTETPGKRISIIMTKKIDLEKEIKLINRRTEESLTIVIEHFKEIEERLDTLEKKVKQSKES
jgi:riboflavin biosynthesis pyrimidine reductase